MDKPTQNGGDSDQDFDPTAEMLVNDFDDEHTLEEEEAMESSESVVNELDDLQKEGEMPLEDLLALYGFNGNKSKSPKEAKPSLVPTVSSSSPPNPLPSVSVMAETVVPVALTNAAPPVTVAPPAPPVPAVQPAPPPLPVAPPTARHHPKLSPEKSSFDATPVPVTPSPSRHHLLRCKSVSQPSEESSGSESDDDGSPDDDWRKMIQVGSDYQAVVPEGLCKYDGAPAYENEDRLLWDPSKLTNEEVEDYLQQAQLPYGGTPGIHSIPTGSHIRDDEQALYLLLQCGHNVEEALRRRRMQPTLPTDTMSLWSEEECRSFENGLRTYGKDFHLIQQNKVRTRSVGELVQFYYLWKKTERHDVFASKTRLEKKKYALHPGTTRDYMDRFLDEQENPSNHRDRSSSPSIQSIIFGDARKPTLAGRTNQGKANENSDAPMPPLAAPPHTPTATVVNSSSDKGLVNGLERLLANADSVNLSRNGGQNFDMVQENSGGKMAAVMTRPPPVWSEMYSSTVPIPNAIVSVAENTMNVSVQENMAISGK